MGILRLIAAILKAVPALGRLFLRFADDQKEKKAQVRYEEKLERIDDAVDKYQRAGLHNSDKAEQRGGANEAPAVPVRSKSSPSVDKGSTKKSGRPRVRARKKVKKKVKSYAPVKKKKGGKKKSV
jgi:hypothetical protein